MGQVAEQKPLDVARPLGPNPRWPQFVGAWHFIKVTMYGVNGYTLDQYDAAEEWGRLLAEWSMGEK